MGDGKVDARRIGRGKNDGERKGGDLRREM